MERLQEVRMPTNRGGGGDEIAIAAGGMAIVITGSIGEPVSETAATVWPGEFTGETVCGSSVTYVSITKSN